MPSGKVPKLRAEGHRAAAVSIGTHKSVCLKQWQCLALTKLAIAPNLTWLFHSTTPLL